MAPAPPPPKDLLVVFPFYFGDANRAIENLEWMAELDGRLDFDCLLSFDDRTDPTSVKAKAETVFRRVFLFQHKRPPEMNWPIPQNAAFANTAWHILKEDRRPWLWLETDAIPTRPGWLTEIWEDHKRGGKPFSSHWNYDNKVFNGVAIYPHDVPRYSTHAMTAWLMDIRDAQNQKQQSPWDVYASNQVFPHLHIMNHLSQHLWEYKGRAPTFPDQDTVDQVVRPNVALFHRNKDGTLIHRLRERMRKPATRSTRTIVSLRRAGDIINLLPLCHKLHGDGTDCRLVVHRGFADLFDGVSYVAPVIWDGDPEDPLAAAQAHSAENAQVWGKGLNPDTATANFARLAWEKLGHKWNRYLPLVFDRRDAGREEALTRGVFRTNKPKLLYKLSGTSSPFTDAGKVELWMKSALGRQAELVCLDKVKADRIYDLLGLYDRAQALLTIDTVTTWLAQASQIPAVQLVNGTGFFASPARGNCLLRVPYQDVLKRWGDIESLLRKALFPKPGMDGMVLVTSAFRPTDPVVINRNRIAEKSWHLLGARHVEFTPPSTRTSAAVGGTRNLPFLKDMIEAGFASGPEDRLVICNNDIIFDPQLAKAITGSCDRHGCYWAYRVDKPGGLTDNGADCFAFTRTWWDLHQHLIPDLLFGCLWWDNNMMRVMRWSGCPEQARLYYHTPHAGVDERKREAGNQYNVSISQAWIKEHNEPDERP